MTGAWMLPVVRRCRANSAPITVAARMTMGLRVAAVDSTYRPVEAAAGARPENAL